MDILKGAAFIYGLAFVTWLFYLAIVNVARIRETMGWEHKVFAYPMLVIGIPLDVLFNVIIGSMIFFEPPKEFLFTARIWRHKQGTGWRKERAEWWCETYLNPFDQGHC